MGHSKRYIRKDLSDKDGERYASQKPKRPPRDAAVKRAQQRQKQRKHKD